VAARNSTSKARFGRETSLPCRMWRLFPDADASNLAARTCQRLAVKLPSLLADNFNRVAILLSRFSCSYPCIWHAPIKPEIWAATHKFYIYNAWASPNWLSMAKLPRLCRPQEQPLFDVAASNNLQYSSAGTPEILPSPRASLISSGAFSFSFPHNETHPVASRSFFAMLARLFLQQGFSFFNYDVSIGLRRCFR